ncbi:hypothetical protein WI560_15450 [Bradyrhizobium sp. A11]|uniref:hypothetical protein n=1 Tax=Bradyrhizobium sp. A11 TaxID=3133974 RepID=UPI00324951AD
MANKAAVREEKIHNRKPPYPVLAVGTLVRTDVYGFRGHDVQVVEDPGPANLITRKVRLEKIEGRQKGERVFVTRDRVKLSPKQ